MYIRYANTAVIWRYSNLPMISMNIKQNARMKSFEVLEWFDMVLRTWEATANQFERMALGIWMIRKDWCILICHHMSFDLGNKAFLYSTLEIWSLYLITNTIRSPSIWVTCFKIDSPMQRQNQLSHSTRWHAWQFRWMITNLEDSDPGKRLRVPTCSNDLHADWIDWWENQALSMDPVVWLRFICRWDVDPIIHGVQWILPTRSTPFIVDLTPLSLQQFQ